MTLTNRILIALGAGIVFGALLNLVTASDLLGNGVSLWLNNVLVDGLFDGVGKIFVASLQLLVVPLVFVSLVCGVCSLGDNSRMGAIAGKTVLLYLLTTAVAVSLALTTALLVQPGSGLNLETSAEFTGADAPPLKDVIINMFPKNPVAAMAEGNMLQIIVFSLLMGYAVSKAGEQGLRVAALFRDFEAVIMKMVRLLMELAPYGVFALIAKLFAQLGVGAIVDLGKYFMTVVFVLLLHGLGTYTLLLRAVGGLSPSTLLLKMRSVWAFAFSTASSGATIPVTMRTVEKRLGVNNSVAAFTVPLGATINMDGTAIMQGVATAFIAQVYGVDIGLTGFLTVVLTATLASIGTAAVPGVGLVMLTMVLTQMNLPVEGIGLIIGVDRLLDMMRTVVNVTGDATVSTLVAKSENQLDVDVYRDPRADVEDR